MRKLETYLKEIKERCDAATPGPEDWKVIPGFTKYKVSNWGEVKTKIRRGNHSKKTSANYRLLSVARDKSGRGSVGIYSDSTQRSTTKRVSHLVLSAFVGPRPEGMHVAHLNGDASDDRLCNLEYCTPKENNAHKKLHGTNGEGEKNANCKYPSWKIQEIKFLASKHIPFGKIADLFDMDQKYISDVVSRKVRATENRTDVEVLLEMVERLLDRYVDDYGKAPVWIETLIPGGDK